MIDVEVIRQEPDRVKEGISKKNADPGLIDKFLALDERWRVFVKNLDDLRAKQKQLSEKREISKAKEVKDETQALEAALREAEASPNEILLHHPHLPLPKNTPRKK